ncbi:MAG: hypothetical protein HQ569_02185 [Actinobacteria bacterium]|nr:hypothetical protein [Actinomycetota bacterium]
MRPLKLFSVFILFLAIPSSFIFSRDFPLPKPLTDEEQIRVIINNIEQGIREQSVLKTTDGFARVFQIGDTTTARFLLWEKLRSIFENSQHRFDDSLFQLITPTGDFTGTWDFEMEIDTIRILNPHIAIAKTWIYFGAAPADTTSNWHFGKKHRENFVFRKEENCEWRLKKVNKLMKILRKYGL